MRLAPCLLTLITLSVLSCSGDNRERNKRKALERNEGKELVTGTFYEGKVTYDVFDQSGDQRSTLEFIFNRNYTLTREKGQTTIFFKSTQEELWINDFNHRISFYQPDSTGPQEEVVSGSGEFKVIHGYLCEKYKFRGEYKRDDVWLSEQFKPGNYPITPVMLYGQLALEYLTQPLAAVKSWRAVSVSNEPVHDSVFMQPLSDSLFLDVPARIFSTDTLDYHEDFFQKNKALSYPYYGEGRDATKQVLDKKIGEVIKSESTVYVSVGVIVEKDGSLVPYTESYDQPDQYTERINRILTSMKRWTPAKVNGVPIRSKVRLSFSNRE